MNCPACGSSNPREARFCNQCGAVLGNAAPGSARRPADYTPRHLADRILTLRSSLEGERKQVTVLFADVKDSVALSSRVGAEAWHLILDRFFRILGDAIHRYEGTVNQYTGDGVMALFGAPFAHEDHAQRACHAALELREALDAYAERLRRERGIEFGARMGMACGEVVVGRIGDDLRMDYTAQGEIVGTAARLQQLARPGSVAVSEAVVRLVGGFFEFDDLGTHDLAGIQTPVRVFELARRGPLRTRLDLAHTRGLSPLVGRDEVLRSLEAGFEQAAAGRGLVMGVEGDAGVGKSRVCQEFALRCRARGASVFEAHCPAHGRTLPGSAARELVLSFFGLDERGGEGAGDAERVTGDRVFADPGAQGLRAAALAVLDPEGATDAAASTAGLAQLLAALIRDRGLDRPVLVCIDDLHWIDAESDALLATLVAEVPRSRCLLLVNFRPEYRAGWLEDPAFHQLGLRPLGSSASGALLDELLGEDPSLSKLRGPLLEAARGNPLFLEEIVRSLREQGHLSGPRGAQRLAGPLEGLELPATLQPLLAARIDRLPEREKRVLQVASVVGFQFEPATLRRVAELSEEDADEVLRVLARAEFVHPKSQYPGAPFVFLHPLTREVAYASLLGKRREELHAAVAVSIQDQGERLGQKADLIAQHWERAGRHHEARRWRMRAGLRVTNIQPRRRHSAPKS